MIIDVALELFDQGAFKGKLAQALGVREEQIVLNVTIASVLVAAEIRADSESQALAVARAGNELRNNLSSAGETLGVPVESIEAPVTFTAVNDRAAPPLPILPPPSHPSESNNISGGAVAGIVIGSLAGVLLLLTGCYYFRAAASTTPKPPANGPTYTTSNRAAGEKVDTV